MVYKDKSIVKIKNKIKSKRNARKYQPDTKLYITLTLLFGFFALNAFITMCIKIENSSVTTIASAIISISGGGLASVIVAWLVDISNCKTKNTYLLNKEKDCLGYIVMFTDELFQSFADACRDFDVINENKEYCWDFWFKKLANNNFNKQNSDFYASMLGTYVSLNEIIGIINEINSGELKDYIVFKDFEILTEMLILRDTCSRIRDKIFIQNKTKMTEQELNHNIFTITDVISTVMLFYKLKNKKYSPNQNVRSEIYEKKSI